MHRRGTKGKFIKHIDPKSLDRVEAIKHLRPENVHVYIHSTVSLSLFKEGSTLGSHQAH